MSADAVEAPTARARLVFAPSTRHLLQIALVQFAAYGLTHWIFRREGGALPLAWMPAGVALSLFLLSAREAWWRVAMAIAIGGMAADLVDGQGSAVGLLGAAATVAVGSLGAAAIRRWGGEDVTFNRLRDVQLLAGVALLLNGLIAALGAAILVQLHPGPYGHVWLTWWMSDLLGILLLPPMLVGMVRRPIMQGQGGWYYPVEWTAFVLVVMAIGRGLLTSNSYVFTPRPYMLLAVVAWAAIRYGTRSVALALFLFSVLVVHSVRMDGEVLAFPGGSLPDRLLAAQIFLAFGSLTGLLLAAARAEGREAERARHEEWEARVREAKEHVQHLEALTTLLNKAQALAHVGHWSWDLRTDRLEMSDELLRMHAITREEFGNHVDPLMQRVHFDDRAHAIAVRQAAMAGQTNEVLTYRVVWPDASLHYIRSEPHEFLVGPDGQPTAIFGTAQDITEQVVARQAIEHSEARFRALFEGHHTPMLVVDPNDLRILDVNAAAAEFYQYTREQLLQMDVVHLAAAPRERVAGRLAEMLRGSTHSFTGLHRLANGETRTVSIDASIIEGPGVPRILAICHDVTDQVRAEAARASSERRYVSLFQSQHVGILLTDEAGKIIEANPASERILGVSRNRQLERRHDAAVWKVVRPDGSPMPPDEFASVRALRTRMAVDDVLMGIEREDGETRWILVSASPLEIPGYGVIIEFVDVTERHAAERQAAQQWARYQSILNVSTDGLHIVDREGWLLESNAAFLQLLGRDPATAHGRLHVSDWDAQIAPDRLRAWLDELWDRPRTFETLHRRADGTTFPVEVAVMPLELDGVRFFVASSRDISARKQRENELQASAESLEARVRVEVARNLEKERLLIHQSRLAAMGEMISAIAHQWRQPLNALSMVMNNLDDVARDGAVPADRVRDAALHAHRLVQQMSTTINDFRDFFRPDKQIVPFSMRDEVRAAVALVQASFDHHHIRVSIEGPDLEVAGFPNEFAQVVLNLLANARDAITETGRTDGEVSAVLESSGGAGILRLRDNGAGISAEGLERIFEPYWTTKSSGTGLGLYMSRLIVQRSLHGEIAAANRPEGGAEFVLILPLARDAARL